MKHFLLLVSCLVTNCLFAQNRFYGTPISKYGPGVETFFRFSPITNHPDSLMAKMLQDEDFVLDTLLVRSDTVNFYMRGYYKTFNPFHIKAERVEVYVLESDLVLNNKKTGRKTLTYMILGVVGREEADLAIVTTEAKRIYDQFRKLVTTTSIQKKKNRKDKTYIRYLYNVGGTSPFYSGFGKWYKTVADYCVSFSVNLVDFEFLKRQDANL